MHVNPGFKLNTVCGESFLIPMGEENINMSKLIGFNESSLCLWNRMSEGEFTVEDLITALTDEYDIDDATARTDIENILAELKGEGVIGD